jgi:hypothetical protein
MHGYLDRAQQLKLQYQQHDKRRPRHGQQGAPRLVLVIEIITNWVRTHLI